MDSKLVFKFKPDVDMDEKLKIHIDITVATPCSSRLFELLSKSIFFLHLFDFLFMNIYCFHTIFNNKRIFFLDIGADILDSTNQNVFSFGILEEQDTWWNLDPEQRTYFEYIQHLNAYLREEYHSLNVSYFVEFSLHFETDVIYSN